VVDYEMVARSYKLRTAGGITTNLWEVPVALNTGYSNAAWPTSSATPLTINYYDAYSGIPALPTGYSKPGNGSVQTRGLLTVTKTAVLNSPAVRSLQLRTDTFEQRVLVNS
jgi:hypothetical protein